MKKLSFILCSVVLMTACQGSKKESGQKVEDKNNVEAKSQKTNMLESSMWVLSEFNGEMVETSIEGGPVHFMLNKDGSKVSGYAGCNQIMGSYETSGDNGLKFRKIATTRRSCPDQNHNEKDFLEVLRNTTSFKLDGKKLILLNVEDKTIAVFDHKEPKARMMDLGQWELKSLKGESVKFDSKGGNKLHFEFLEDNKIAGFSGCNTFSGAYSLNKDQGIEFSQMISTLKSCPEVEFKEALFLKVFEYSASYRIENDQFKLYNADGKELASFTAL